jgi:hypothetical protein
VNVAEGERIADWLGEGVDGVAVRMTVLVSTGRRVADAVIVGIRV